MTLLGQLKSTSVRATSKELTEKRDGKDHQYIRRHPQVPVMSKRRHNNYSVLRSQSSLRGYLSRQIVAVGIVSGRENRLNRHGRVEDHAIRLAFISGAMTHVQEPNSQAYQETKVRLDWDV